MQQFIEYDDILAWRDEVGVKKGVVYENGRVLFNQWPVRPHEQIVNEFNIQFVSQLSSRYVGTVQHPVFINDGTTGIYLSRMNLMCETYESPVQVAIKNPMLPGGPNLVPKPNSRTPYSLSSRTNRTANLTHPS